MLNHPEIPYPISSEICDRTSPSPRYSKESFDGPFFDQKKANLDYHRLNALAYEQQSEEAQKFLKEFGIFGPMGNGVAVRRSSRTSPDSEMIQQIRKSSKALDNEPSSRNSGSLEDYEYLKSVVLRLKKELSELEIKYGALQTELFQTQKSLHCKESEIIRMQREVHKLKVSTNYFLGNI